MQKENGFPKAECALLCAHLLASSYEPTYGGFGSRLRMNSPKFPEPINFNFLFSTYALSTSPELRKRCLEMSLHTLMKMAHGGIHDHVGQVRSVPRSLQLFRANRISLICRSKGVLKVRRGRWMARPSFRENALRSSPDHTNLCWCLHRHEGFVLFWHCRWHCHVRRTWSATQGIIQLCILLVE